MLNCSDMSKRPNTCVARKYQLRAYDWLMLEMLMGLRLQTVTDGNSSSAAALKFLLINVSYKK